ncbi:GH25 family lysozyme [Nonomuraea sp. B12E4]|uniref:GH25 family lysozyme n=1 Tax=Nonomuraea sp. B12E4 TaxID=3153564 RepID=UPI00325E382C
MISGVKRLLSLVVIAGIGMGGAGAAEAADGITGVDVSNWTGEIDWGGVSSGGGRFAFVQATEGTNYRNPSFDAQYGGAAAAGLIRGAYHFAQPHESDGTAQADYFLQNGGNWVSDGLTLPGVLDIEDNPYKDRNGKNSCYGLSVADMVTWIKDFTKKYHSETGRQAIIYTTTSWWQTCTGDSDAFKANPLWLARWGTDPGELPKSWKKYTFWQSAEKGPLAGGGNAYNGSESQLAELANPPAEVTVSGAAKSRKTYTVTLSNTGPHPVKDVKVSGRTFGGHRVVKASGCKFSGTAVSCTLKELARGQKKTFTVTTNAKVKGTVGMNFTVGSIKVTLKAG